MTLNQVVKSLRDFASDHQQINSFDCCEEYNFATSGVVEMQTMIAVLQPSQLVGSTLTYNFKIYIGDLVHKDLSNRVEVLSDTLLTCLDLIGYLQRPEFEGVIDTNITINDFEDSFDCELYGHWFNLKIKTSSPFDRCAIPIT